MNHYYAKCEKMYQRYTNTEYVKFCNEDKFTLVVTEEIFNSIYLGEEITLTYNKGVVTK